MTCQTKIQDDARLVEQMIIFFYQLHCTGLFLGSKMQGNQGSISMILIEMCKDVHPRKLTWNLKITGWKMYSLLLK